MGKVSINAGSLVGAQPGGEHITRIMRDDNEPPKNYIWEKPNGLYYIWNGYKWILLNERAITFNPSDYYSREELDSKLNTLKTQIVAILRRYVEAKACSDCGGGEGGGSGSGDNYDHSQFITAEIVNDINNLDI